MSSFSRHASKQMTLQPSSLQTKPPSRASTAFLPFIPFPISYIFLRSQTQSEKPLCSTVSPPQLHSRSLSLSRISLSVPPALLLSLTLATTIPFPNPAHSLGLSQGILSECPPSTITCVSSQDDIPISFLEPWEYDQPLPLLQTRLLSLVLSLPHSILITQQPRYLRFEIYASPNKVDDLEFYFPPDDHLVHFRSARRDASFDWWKNRRRLDHIRQQLGLEQIAVLRNRMSRLRLFETPLDSFGPSAVDVDAIIGNRGVGSRALR